MTVKEKTKFRMIQNDKRPARLKQHSKWRCIWTEHPKENSYIKNINKDTTQLRATTKNNTASVPQYLTYLTISHILRKV